VQASPPSSGGQVTAPLSGKSLFAYVPQVVKNVVSDQMNRISQVFKQVQLCCSDSEVCCVLEQGLDKEQMQRKITFDQQVFQVLDRNCLKMEYLSVAKLKRSSLKSFNFVVRSCSFCVLSSSLSPACKSTTTLSPNS
jgi:hypothetical protein